MSARNINVIGLIPQDHDMESPSSSDEEADEVDRAMLADRVAEKRMAALVAAQYWSQVISSPGIYWRS
jgi:hypothetical protein